IAMINPPPDRFAEPPYWRGFAWGVRSPEPRRNGAPRFGWRRRIRHPCRARSGGWPESDRAREETWTFRRIRPRTILLPARPVAKAWARWQAQARSRADAARHGRGSELPCAGDPGKRPARADFAPSHGCRGSRRESAT